MSKPKFKERPWGATVEPWKGLFRVMVTRYGMTSPAGARLYRGLPISGKMFDGVFIASTKEAAQRSADDLKKYLNNYEANRTKKRK